MTDTIVIAVVVIGFIILLLLNIFFVYIPVYRIEKALEDIDNKVQMAAKEVQPVIEKVLPLLTSL